ncbi:MAG TPA: MATE family efflux transporter, partial [Candidatus Eisenbacteria bacterium]|nr:MATE family efflux transporter [Candidatus Eisenbacteria bacterium]
MKEIAPHDRPIPSQVDHDPPRDPFIAESAGLTVSDKTTPPPSGSTVPDTPRSVWSELRDAVRGTGADYTKIPLRRAVFLLAVPMVLELVLEATFAVVDIYFVGKLGSSAIATVGLTETMLFLLYAIAMGLAMAVTAVVARR